MGRKRSTIMDIRWNWSAWWHRVTDSRI